MEVSSSVPEQSQGESDDGQQLKCERLDLESPCVEGGADTGSQFSNLGSKADADTAEDEGDWLTHTVKRRGSSNKRPPTSRLAEIKTGGLSAAFKAKDSHDEDTFLLDEELETSERSNLKDHQSTVKRFAGSSN